MKPFHLMLLSIALIAVLDCQRPGAETGSSTESVQLPDSLRLAYGVRTTVSGSSVAVTFDSVVQDSRCSTDVVCVWAGELVVNVRIEQTGSASPAGMIEPHRFSTLNGRVQEAFGYRFELIAERPVKRSTETVPPKSYWIALRVTPRVDD